MQQLTDNDRKLCGAKGDEIVDGFTLAREAWGEPCQQSNSGLMAFSYLWRRFGPPFRGSDPHKDLVSYTLTTKDPDVFLWITPSGSSLDLAVGYIADEKIRTAHNRPMVQWEKRFRAWHWKQNPEFETWKETKRNCERYNKRYWNARMDPKVMEQAKAVLGEYPARRMKMASDWRTGSRIQKRVNQALFDAMKELEKPVRVRDVAINIFGRCDYGRREAKESPYAGYPVPKEAMDGLLAADAA